MKTKSGVDRINNSSQWHAGGEKKVSVWYRYRQIRPLGVSVSEMKMVYGTISSQNVYALKEYISVSCAVLKEINVPNRRSLFSSEIRGVLRLLWSQRRRHQMRNVITQRSYISPTAPAPCDHSPIILPWLIILWAHWGIWCMARCQVTGEFFILLVLLSVSVFTEGWCIVPRASQKQCTTEYNRILHVSMRHVTLTDTLMRSPDSVWQGWRADTIVRMPK